MKTIPQNKIFTLIEPGPVTLITTRDAHGRANVMTITWTMVLDFSPRFAIATGPWNYSFAALLKTHECVIAVPDAAMIDTVIGIGTTTGADADMDKFARFGLTAMDADNVRAPLIAECMANIECRVANYDKKNGIIILDAVCAHGISGDAAAHKMLHAVGDGTFTMGSRNDKIINRRRAMASKLPDLS